MSDTEILTAQEQFDLDSQSPIYCELVAELFDELMASSQLFDEARIGEFDYFDDLEWDKWTELTVAMPISHAINRLTALTTATQQMTILAPVGTEVS